MSASIPAARTGRSSQWIVRPFELLVRHRRLLWATTCNDIRARYAGSALGLIWVVLYPLLFLGAYAAVFLYIFNVRFALFDSNEYVVLIFCGLIPFLGFTEALGAGVGSISGNAHLIKNTLFPVDLLPVKAVLTSQCTQLAGTGLLLVALAVLGRLTPWALLAVPIWVCQILFTIGLLWILGSLNVYFRDLQNSIGVVILLMMMISPIAYTYDMVPENLRLLVRLNPLSYLIISYQSVLMLGALPPLEVAVPLVVASLGTFLVGHVFFRRLKSVFADSI